MSDFRVGDRVRFERDRAELGTVIGFTEFEGLPMVEPDDGEKVLALFSIDPDERYWVRTAFIELVERPDPLVEGDLMLVVGPTIYGIRTYVGQIVEFVRRNQFQFRMVYVDVPGESQAVPFFEQHLELVSDLDSDLDSEWDYTTEMALKGVIVDGQNE